MIRLRWFPVRAIGADLSMALLVAGGTGAAVLLQRVLVFDSLEKSPANIFAQVMAIWAVISVFFGRIQHRSMALAGAQTRQASVPHTLDWQFESTCLAFGVFAGLSALVVSAQTTSLVLSSIGYVSCLPVLLALIGRHYGNDSATSAQAASFLIATVQLVAIVLISIVAEPSVRTVCATLTLCTAVGTSTLRFWWRHYEPIHWQVLLRPVRDLFVGSVALASSWAACQADIFALALVDSGSAVSAFGSAIYLGKTGLYLVMPIIPILAKHAHCGKLGENWGLLVITCLGAVLASASVLLVLVLSGTLPSSLLGSNFHLLALIALSQAPSVTMLTFSYRSAMVPKASALESLIPLASLGLVAFSFRRFSEQPSVVLVVHGLSLTVFAVMLANYTTRGFGGRARGQARRGNLREWTSMFRRDLG